LQLFPDPEDDAPIWAGPDPDRVYVLQNSEGEVKAIFGSKSEALAHQLAPGDALIATSTANLLSIWPGSGLEQIKKKAQEYASELMQVAQDTACDFNLPPESVTPSVQVSFNLLAGASFRMSATWDTSKLCPE